MVINIKLNTAITTEYVSIRANKGSHYLTSTIEWTSMSIMLQKLAVAAIAATASFASVETTATKVPSVVLLNTSYVFISVFLF
jgi:hypothetical protein